MSLEKSRFLMLVLMSAIVSSGAFAQSRTTTQISEDQDSPAKIGEPPVQPQTPAASGSCDSAFSQAGAVCNEYLGASKDGGAEKIDAISTADGLKKINNDLKAALNKSRSESYKCVTAANECKKQCGGSGNSAKTLACDNQRAAAIRKYAAFRYAAHQARDRNEEVGNDISQNHPGEGKMEEGSMPSLPNGGLHAGATPDSGLPPTNMNPQSTIASEKPTEKTPEQLRKERRDKRADERRQERIDALGKAFMDLNPQKPLNQAMQEQAVTPNTQQAAIAAATVASKAGPVTEKERPVEQKNQNYAEERDDEGMGRAGFNALAERNLKTRKALAAAMGLNAAALPGGGGRSSSLQPASTLGQAPVFGGHQSFDYSGSGAALDPMVDAERPSDLPQNFHLGVPSMGGGGGGQPSVGPAKKLATKKHSDPPQNEEQPIDRRPAGLEHSSQIRPMAADIWTVITVSFRRHCAEGRLMDCASHLPNQ